MLSQRSVRFFFYLSSFFLFFFNSIGPVVDFKFLEKNSTIKSLNNLLEEHLFINYLYPMKLNRIKLNEISLQDNNVAKVLDNYLENFDEEATLDIHQLIARA